MCRRTEGTILASNKRNNRGRNLLVLLLCLPLAFIAYFAISYSNETIAPDTVKTIVIETPDGIRSEFADAENIDFLVSLVLDSTEIKSAVRDIKNETPVIITYDRGDKLLQYKLYPSLTLSGCLVFGPDDFKGILRSEDAGELLLMDEFSYLYSSYFLPELLVTTGSTEKPVTPKEYSWSHVKSDSNYYEYTLTETTDEINIYSVLKGFENSLAFTVQPDTLEISYVTESGVSLSISSIASLDFSVDTLISVTINASWSSTNNAKYYGSASYEFSLLYDIPALITLNKHEFRPGECIEITATHLNENETVTLETMINTTPLEFRIVDDTSGVAVLPIPGNTTVGVYTLTLTSGTETINESITVIPNAGSVWSTLSVSGDNYLLYLAESKMLEYKNATANAVQSRPTTDYYEYGLGLFPPVSKGDIVYSYGDTVNCANTEITESGSNMTVNGTVYAVADGTVVRSSQAGKVVYCGELAPTGNTVIVYHGYGIYTHYYHLESISVAVGEVVVSEQEVGIAGKAPYVGDRTVLHYAISIDDIFIDPEMFITK